MRKTQTNKNSVHWAMGKEKILALKITVIFLLSKNTKTKGRGIWWCLQQQQLINELFLGGAAGIRRAALRK